MRKKLIKKSIKAKSGLSKIPFLEQITGSSGMNLFDKYKGEAGKELLKQQGLSLGTNLVEAGGQKLINTVNSDFYTHNPTAGAIQNLRNQALSSIGSTIGGPFGEIAGRIASKVLDIGEAALAKDDCVPDPMTGKPMIDPNTGNCLKRKNALDSLSMTGNIQDMVDSFKNIGKGYGFADVAQSIAASTPIGKILGLKNKIQEKKINQRSIASTNQYDLLNQINQSKAAAIAESERLQRLALNPAFGTYAKKGTIIPKLRGNCGCNKEKDGLDTDIFYGMPRRLFNQVLRRINLPEGTPYSDKVKIILKNSVPPNMSLREYVERISPEVKEYIRQKSKSNK